MGPYNHPYLLNSWEYIGNSYSIPTVTQIKQAIFSYGPVSVGIYVNPAFQSYSGGIFNVSENKTINHGVVLVGWDDSQGKNGVWILRNSWGSDWGENGYMRIEYGCSNVGYAANYVVYQPDEPMPEPLLYKLTDLGTLGGSLSEATAINDLGQVVGSAETSEGYQRAFIWDANNGMNDLGTILPVLPGDNTAQAGAWGINNNGQVVGWVNSKHVSHTPHAFLWTPGGTDGEAYNPQMKTLGTIASGCCPHNNVDGWRSVAYDINEDGQVVGWSDADGECDERAFLWTPGGTDGVPHNPQMKHLGSLGGADSQAWGINNSGFVTGWSFLSAKACDEEMSRIFIWDSVEGMTAVRGEDNYYSYFYGAGNSINETGQIVGWQYGSGVGNLDPFLYTPGNVTASGGPILQTIGRLGGNNGCALGCNNKGQVVGWSEITPGKPQRHAFLWQNDMLYDLNNLIIASDNQGWILEVASAINENGQIVGYGSYNGKKRAFLLTPKDYDRIAPYINKKESRILTSNLPNTDIYYVPLVDDETYVSLTGVSGNTQESTDWTIFGNAIKTDSDAREGDIRMVVRVGYDETLLNQLPESELQLLTFDAEGNLWIQAGVNNSNCITYYYVSDISGEYTPGNSDPHNLQIGDRGVNISDNFVWAVVDHAGEFAVGYPRGFYKSPDINNDCFVDDKDLSIMFEKWMVPPSNMFDGLVGYWSFDEGEGTMAYDESGNGNNGTIYGASYVEGISETAMSFDGVNDYIVSPNNSSQQIQTNQLSISAWFYLNADVGNDQKRIISKQQIAGNSWGLEIFGEGYGGGRGNDICFHDSNGWAWYNCISNDNLNIQQWFHVIVTDNSGTLNIYLNNQKVHTCESPYGIPSNINASISIGCSHEKAPSHFFDGLIDEVRLYNRILTAQEIEYLYLYPQTVCIPHSADLNHDGIVNFEDFAMLASQWLSYPEGCVK